MTEVGYIKPEDFKELELFLDRTSGRVLKRLGARRQRRTSGGVQRV